MSKIYCSECETPLEETHTTDDPQGNVRQYFKCKCGREIYAIVATTEDDEEGPVTEVTQERIPGRIIAHFVPQVWVNDYAERVKGEKYFDVTDAILALGREKALALRDDQQETDDLVPSHMRDHDGPFFIEVSEQIREYFVNLDEQNLGKGTEGGR